MVDLAKQNKEKERRRAEELANGPFNLPESPRKRNLPTYQIQMQLEFKRPLGQGSFSRVDEVQETSTGQLYACKRILLDEGSSMELRDLENTAKAEVAIMQKLHHRHIASVLFSIRDTVSYNIFMLPVADCDLRRYLEHCIRAGYPTALVNPIFQWFGCLLDGMNHAHKQRIKHRYQAIEHLNQR
jgi:serine/threonine protein kinase